MKIKVSIILSLYNSENSLEKTVKSVLNQDYKNFELLIINDGSTDNTKKILNQYRKYKKIKIFNFTSNRGLGLRLNYGILKSRGNLIARIDDNDIMPKTRIKSQLKYFKLNNNLDILGGSAIYLKKYRKKKINMLLKNEEIKNNLILFNPLIHSSIMFKKKSITKIGGYDPNYLRCQDYELWLRAKHTLNFKNSKKIFVIRDVGDFNYQFLNIIFLLKARFKNIKNIFFYPLILILFLKDLAVYLLMNLGIKKII